MDLTRLAAWALAGLLAIIAVSRVLGGGDEPPPVALEPPAAAAEQAAPGADPAAEPGPPAGGLHVHVAGAVRRPGVYRVAPGSRVDAAVQAAGGFGRRADAAAVNLAAPVQDGQQVVVPERGAAGAVAASGASAPAGGAPDGTRISLSTATAEQLETLDGIGPALAARIIEYRDAHGGFRSIDELQEVDGIGEKRFAALRDAVRP